MNTSSNTRLKGFKDFTAKSFLEYAKNNNKNLYEVFLEFEQDFTKKSEKEILSILEARLRIMKRAINESIQTRKETMGKMGGEITNTLHEYFIDTSNEFAVGELGRKAALYGIATNEENACMGCIVACPTAGGSGVVPGVLFAAKEQFNYSNTKIIEALLVASGIGAFIAHMSSLSGAEGGCQAEVGSGVAMAGAALTYLRGGNNQQCIEAATLGLKNLLGLACDPIGGLVEVPCIKRNGFGTQFSLLASDMAMAGIKSFVPFDEVVLAMKEIGDLLPIELKETAKGGLATTPTGLAVNKKMGFIL